MSTSSYFGGCIESEKLEQMFVYNVRAQWYVAVDKNITLIV